jgi:thermitase
MRALSTFVRVTLLGAMAATALQASAADSYQTGVVLVKFKPSSAIAPYFVPPRIGATIIGSNPAIKWWTLRLQQRMSVPAAIAKLKLFPEVLYVEPNYTRKLAFIPNDPNFSQQYGPQKIGCESAWNFTLGASTVKIATIDTGIDTTHAEFAGRIDIEAGCNFVPKENVNDPTDIDGHGTHVAGICAASTNNGVGIAGICGNATILPVKVIENDSSTIDAVSHGYIFAANHGANVINASLGGQDPSEEEQDAVNYALSKGCLFVAAAGNGGTTGPEYPAGYQGVIPVAASDAMDHQTTYTTFGWPLVAAPGDEILSTWPVGLGSYATESGTSMSTPHVTGSLALLMSAAPAGTDPSAIENMLFSTTDYVGSWVQYGRINVGSAMTLLQDIEAGSAVCNPAGAIAYEGTVVSGNVSSLRMAEGSALTISSITPYFGAENASALIELRLPANTLKITAATLNFVAKGANNGENQVYLYDYLQNRYVFIGQVAMHATDLSLHQVALPIPISRYARNGDMYLVLRGNMSSATQFNYAIDEATVSITTPSGP